MSSPLLSLPNELVIAILSNLPIVDLFRCEQVCKTLHSLIKSSTELQYLIALEQAGYEDVPSSAVGIPTKLEKLKAAYESWHNLKARFVTEVEVTHRPSGIYDLCGGIYLLGEETRHTLYHLTLPQHEDDKPEWKGITVTESIIDMGLSVDEHDLIAIITTTPIPITEPEEQQLHEIGLHLLQFSTGQPHPDVKVHRLVVHRSKLDRPAIGMEIVGDNLILILSHWRGGPHRPEDRLFVFEWKTGKLKMSLVAPNRSYSGPIFLAEHYFLLPNSKKGLLEVWDIPRGTSEPSPSSPRCNLLLPTLAPGRIFTSISCRGEPNPMGDTSLPGSKFRHRPYQANTDSAIMIFNVNVEPSLNRFGIHLGHTYSFFVHRRSIINVVEGVEKGLYSDASVTNGSLPPATLPVGSPPIDIHFPGPSDKPTELPGHESPTVPWAEWGPKCTRWFEVDRLPTRWITTTAGQRAVLMGREPTGGTTFMVFDFNPWNVKRVAWEDKQRQRRRRERKGKGKAVEAEDEKEDLKGKGVDRGETQVEPPTIETGSVHSPSEDGREENGATSEAADDYFYHGSPTESIMALEGDIVLEPDSVEEVEDDEDGWVTEEDEGEGEGEVENDENEPPAQQPQPLPAAGGPLNFTMLDLQHLHPGFVALLFGENGAAIQAQLAALQAPIMNNDGLGHLGELLAPEEAGGSGSSDSSNGNGTRGGSSSHAMPGAWQESDEEREESVVQAASDDEWDDDDDDDRGRGYGRDQHGRPKNGVVYKQPNQVDKIGRSFESPIISELPFVQYVARNQPSYDGVLMDEERILGIVTDEMDVIKRVDVHYFG